MGKFSKEFEENQIKKLKRCYINYNDMKEQIKAKYAELDQVQDKNKFIDKATTDFVTSLNIELKKVITSYNHQEKEIKLIMNSLLHNRNNYNSYVLVQIQKEYQEMVNVSEITLHLVKFSYYNLLSLQKLLSKFDKIFCVDIKYNYIQSKIEEKGKALLYILKFRIVNEVTALIEDLLKVLELVIKKGKFAPKDIPECPSLSLSSNKMSGLIEAGSDISSEEKITNEQVLSLITKQKKLIDDNMKETEHFYSSTQSLYNKWEQYLSLNVKPNTKEEINQNLSTDTVMLISKENISNIYVIFFETFYSMISYSNVLSYYPFLSNLYNQIHLSDEIKTPHLSLLMSIPLIGYFINMAVVSKTLENRYYKTPSIIFTVISMLGNSLNCYILLKPPSDYIFIFLQSVARFFIGFGTNKYLNNNYIAQYVPKRKCDKYLRKIRYISLFSFGFGNLIWIVSLFFPKKINMNWINALFPLIGVFILIGEIAFYKEPYKTGFNIYNSNQNESVIGKSLEINYASDQDTFENEEEDESIASYERHRNNSISDFKDLNLIRQSISELAWREEKTSGFIKKSYVLLLIFELCISFIFQNLLLTIPIFVIFLNGDNISLTISLIEIVSVIFIIYIISLFSNVLFLSSYQTKNSERTLLLISIIIMLFLSIFSFCLYLPRFLSSIKIYLYLVVICAMVSLESTKESLINLLISKIIPVDFHMCKVSIAFSFNCAKTIGLLLGSIVIVIIDFREENYLYNIFMLGVNTFILAVMFILLLLFFAQFKVKAISRIMNERALVKSQSVARLI